MDNRHIACTMTSVMLRLVRDEAGDEAVVALLREARTTRTPAFLETTDNWISLDEAVGLVKASCVVTGDPSFPRRVGEHAVRQHAGTAVATLLRSLGSPEAVLGAISMTAAKFSTVTEMETIEAAPGIAVVHSRSRAGCSRHPLMCQWTQGLLSCITVLFGLPPAAVAESTCQADGAAECRYTITWDAAQAAVGADPQQRVTALEAQLLAMSERLRAVYHTAGDLLSVDDLDVVLARIVDRAALTVRAPRYVLAVRPGPDAEQRLYTDGVNDQDAARLARAAAAGEELGASALVAEVASSRYAYGRLIALNDDGLQFFPQERELLELYAKHAAAVLDMATALEESANRHDHVSALLHLAQALASTGTSREVTDRLAEAVPAVVDCDRMSVLLWDDRERWLLTTSTWGMPPADVERLSRLPISPEASEGVAQMLTDPRPLFFDPVTADPFLRALMGEMGLARMVAVPIIARGQFLGVLTVSVVERPERLRGEPALLERLTGVAALAAPAIQNGQLVDALQHQAAHDPLTGLANRAGFARHMSRVIEQAGDAHVGLLFVDLDGFKQVNDVHGHGAGDALLREAGRRLASIVRARDIVARLGGDEFAVILAGVTSGDEVARAARRVREAFVEPFDVGGTPVSVGASVGEARWPADGAGVEALIRHADAAMYREKSRARR